MIFLSLGINLTLSERMCEWLQSPHLEVRAADNGRGRKNEPRELAFPGSGIRFKRGGGTNAARLSRSSLGSEATREVRRARRGRASVFFESHGAGVNGFHQHLGGFSLAEISRRPRFQHGIAYFYFFIHG